MGIRILVVIFFFISLVTEVVADPSIIYGLELKSNGQFKQFRRVGSVDVNVIAGRVVFDDFVWRGQVRNYPKVTQVPSVAYKDSYKALLSYQKSRLKVVTYSGRKTNPPFGWDVFASAEEASLVYTTQAFVKGNVHTTVTYIISGKPLLTIMYRGDNPNGEGVPHLVYIGEK